MLDTCFDFLLTVKTKREHKYDNSVSVLVAVNKISAPLRLLWHALLRACYELR